MAEKQKVILCEVYSRIVGYYRPVQNWNPGKKQEFEERKTFKNWCKEGERYDHQKFHQNLSC